MVTICSAPRAVHGSKGKFSMLDACCACGGGLGDNELRKWEEDYEANEVEIVVNSSTTCFDLYDDWENRFGYGCNYFKDFKVCGGDIEWPLHGSRINSFYDDVGRYSPLEACCACGGGSSERWWAIEEGEDGGCRDEYGGDFKPWDDFVSCADEADACEDNPDTLGVHCAKTCGTCESDDTCTDYPDWVTQIGYGCSWFAEYTACGGDKEWVGTYPLSHYRDKKGSFTAFDACCACGGGYLEGEDTLAPTKLPTSSPTTSVPTASDSIFESIRQSIENAPTNGNVTIIEIEDPFIFWSMEITIKSGQNIILRGNPTIRPILDARNTTNHITVKPGASFSASNLEFTNGNKGALTCVRCELDFIVNCTFRGNTMVRQYNTRGGAIYFYMAGFRKISGCLFIDNQASSTGGAIYIEKAKFSHPAIISDSKFVRNRVESNGQPTGGAISIYECHGPGFLIVDSEFRENIASVGLGGALSLMESPFFMA